MTQSSRAWIAGFARLSLIALAACEVPWADELGQPPIGVGIGGETCDGRSSLVLSEGTLSGDVNVGVILTWPQGEPAWIALQVSTDGVLWRDATVTGETRGLLTDAEGIRHDFQWDTLADLGAGRFEGVQLRVVTYAEPETSRCGAWAPLDSGPLTVENAEPPVPTCAVAMQSEAAVQEGAIDIPFAVAHPESATVWVQAEWSRDGTAWRALLPDDAPCEIGRFDLDALPTSPLGVGACLRWASDDPGYFPEDGDVFVRLSCGTRLAVEGTATASFTLNNDPTPKPGQVALSELLVASDVAGGQYIELTNTAGHALNLQGVSIRRFNANQDRATATPAAAWTIDVPSETLRVPPGGVALFAPDDDPAANGCLDPDATWGSAPLLAQNSTLELLGADGALWGAVSFFFTEGWFFDQNVAQAVAPGADWTTREAWCVQSSAVDACEVSTPLIGTPGAPNDTCP